MSEQGCCVDWTPHAGPHHDAQGLTVQPEQRDGCLQEEVLPMSEQRRRAALVPESKAPPFYKDLPAPDESCSDVHPFSAADEHQHADGSEPRRHRRSASLQRVPT